MEQPDTEEDWCAECSDEEKYSYPGGEKGVWEPAPQDIKELYEKLAAGEELTLTWSWPRGRRSPSPEPAEESMEQDTAPKEVQKEEKQLPTEFDFDDFGDGPPTALTPRRTPGAKTPRSSQKRIARMDKIMEDLRKEKKSMSPGQRNMVPGHRPLPGLGGAHRMAPKAGMFGGPGGGQRSPAAAQGLMGPAVLKTHVAGGQPPPTAQRATTSSAPNQDSSKPTPGGATVSPAAAASAVSSSASPATSTSAQIAAGNVPQPSNTAEQVRPTAQPVTLVQPSDEGPAQRPAVPKLKIRKDLIL